MKYASIYEAIKANLTEEGTLPNEFELDESMRGRSGFVPGGLDGMGVQGHYRVQDGDEEAAQILDLMKEFFQNGDRSYLEKITSVLDECHTLALIDPLKKMMSFAALADRNLA